MDDLARAAAAVGGQRPVEAFAITASDRVDYPELSSTHGQAEAIAAFRAPLAEHQRVDADGAMATKSPAEPEPALRPGSKQPAVIGPQDPAITTDHDEVHP